MAAPTPLSEWPTTRAVGSLDLVGGVELAGHAFDVIMML
jgi:hypothetical protein